MKRYFPFRTIAVGVLVLGLAVMLFGLRQRKETEAEVTRLQQRNRDLIAQITTLETKENDRLREPKRLPPILRQSENVPRVDPTAQLLASRPELLDLFLRCSRANNQERFAVFYQMASLSPEQRTKFNELAAKHQEALMDIYAAAANQGISQGDPAIVVLRKQEETQFLSDQKTVLGETGFREFQNFARMEGALNLVDGSAHIALDPQTAYTTTQTEQLTQIVANASSTYRQGGKFDPATVDWDAALAQAELVVNAPQLNALRVQAEAMKLYGWMQTYVGQNARK